MVLDLDLFSPSQDGKLFSKKAQPYLHLTDASIKSTSLGAVVVVKGYQLPGAFIHDQCGFELIIHTLVEFSKMVTERKTMAETFAILKIWDKLPELESWGPGKGRHGPKGRLLCHTHWDWKTDPFNTLPWLTGRVQLGLWSFAKLNRPLRSTRFDA